jgi:hypothetical protein
MATDTDYRVRVTEKHIRTGIAGDCNYCAVAMALDEATGDTDCMVVEIDWTLRLRVWSHWIVASPEVRRFVYDLDGLARKADGRPKLPRKLKGSDVAPFEFALPPLTDPAWEEECNGCGELFDRGELDGEGSCPDCRERGDASDGRPRLRDRAQGRD